MSSSASTGTSPRFFGDCNIDIVNYLWSAGITCLDEFHSERATPDIRKEWSRTSPLRCVKFRLSAPTTTQFTSLNQGEVYPSPLLRSALGSNCCDAAIVNQGLLSVDRLHFCSPSGDAHYLISVDLRVMPMTRCVICLFLSNFSHSTSLSSIRHTRSDKATCVYGVQLATSLFNKLPPFNLKEFRSCFALHDPTCPLVRHLIPRGKLLGLLPLILPPCRGVVSIEEIFTYCIEFVLLEYVCCFIRLVFLMRLCSPLLCLRQSVLCCPNSTQFLRFGPCTQDIISPTRKVRHRDPHVADWSTLLCGVLGYSCE